MISKFRNNLVDNLGKCSTAGIIVFSEGREIKEISESLLTLLGYSKEEVLGRKVENFIPEDLRRSVLTQFERVKSSEEECVTFNLPIITKDTGIYYFHILLVKQEGEYLCMMVEHTMEEIERIFYGILKEVNRVILKSTSEVEVFKKLTEIFGSYREISWTAFLKCFGDSYRTVMVSDNDGKVFSEVMEKLARENECILHNALRENQVLIIEDLEGSKLKEDIRDSLKDLGVNSMAVVPIYRLGEPYVAMLLLSPYRRVFLERYREILEELKADLEFILEKIEKERLARMFLETFENGKFPMVVLDKDLKIIQANKSFYELVKERGSVEGKDIREFIYEEDLQLFEEYLENKRKEKSVIIRLEKEDGSFSLLDVVITKLKHGKERFYVLVGRDITYEKELEKKIIMLTQIDLKTEVLTRDSFMEEMQKFLEKFPHQYHLLILVDIKNFSEINRVYGHKVGDEILKQFAERLKHVVYGRDFIGRLGADEFGIFFVYIQLRKISAILERILEVLKKPFYVEGEKLSIAFNIGVVVYPFDGKKVDELVQKVFVALKRAKEDGENNYKFFSKKFQEDSERYIRVHNLLTKAFEEDRIELFYQPVYDGESLKLKGFEGLMRIVEDGKIISPSEFIDILEKSELSVEVDIRNLKKAEEFFRKMKKKRFLSLNISPKSFKEMRFLRSLMDFSEDFRNFLILEITERLIVEDIKHTKKVLNILKKMNIKVFIDDFGTGYSSFSYLDELPVNGLKIDMSFVRKIVKRKKTRSVVKTIVNLCKDLGIKTTAEGVEEEQQVKLLKEFGCDLMQGFYFSEPLPRDKALTIG